MVCRFVTMVACIILKLEFLFCSVMVAWLVLMSVAYLMC